MSEDQSNPAGDPPAGETPAGETPAGETPAESSAPAAQDTPLSGGPGGDPAVAGGERAAPYQNLWVPLIVIPAGIVISIVLVFSLFGLISGSEASLSENLDRAVHGGTNERTQALYNIARQVDENELARREGRDLPWPMEQGFVERVREALDRVEEDSHEARLTFAVLLSTLGDESSINDLIELLSLSSEEDEGGRVRFAAAVNLGKIGDDRAREPMLALIESDDEGLRAVAAVALQALPGEGVDEALVGALSDPSLQVRGNAALALAAKHPDHAQAASILFELLEPDTYTSENDRDGKKYSSAKVVSRNRIQAAQTLASMTVPGVRGRLEELRSDPDIELREAVMIALDGDASTAGDAGGS